MNDSYVCPLCHNSYVSEKNLNKHKCKIKERIHYLSTNKGQRCFYLFNKWRSVKNIPEVDIETFLESKYFKQFQKFTDYLDSICIPSLELFFKYVITNSIQPSIWCDKRLISKYYNFLDNQADPIKLSEMSIKTILSYCKDKNIKSELFFDFIPFPLLVHFIQLRKLSPWVLLLSTRYKNNYKNLKDYQQKILDAHINLMLWKIRFQKCPNDVKFIKCLLNQIKL